MHSWHAHLLVRLDGFSLLDIEHLLDVLALVRDKLGQVQDDLTQEIGVVLGLRQSIRCTISGP